MTSTRWAPTASPCRPRRPLAKGWTLGSTVRGDVPEWRHHVRGGSHLLQRHRLGRFAVRRPRRPSGPTAAPSSTTGSTCRVTRRPSTPPRPPTPRPTCRTRTPSSPASTARSTRSSDCSTPCWRFAVLIALLGIANTLALSIFERTRELGLLRAVGMGRSQVRSAIRWESIIIAVFGTTLGLAIGTFFGWAIVRAMADEGIDTLTVPVTSLAVVDSHRRLRRSDGCGDAGPPGRQARRAEGARHGVAQPVPPTLPQPTCVEIFRVSAEGLDTAASATRARCVRRRRSRGRGATRRSGRRRR